MPSKVSEVLKNWSSGSLCPNEAEMEYRKTIDDLYLNVTGNANMN
ncbi:hypothetical protein Tco_0521374, partial [Tanacetum coccineum]